MQVWIFLYWQRERALIIGIRLLAQTGGLEVGQGMAGPKAHASIASLIRLRVSGRLRNRFPVASAMALAIEAAAGPCPVSPLPRNGWPSRLMICTSMLSGTALKRRIG